MTAAVLSDRIADASPLITARVAGAFYSLAGLIALAVFLSGRLAGTGNAVATEANILAHESLFWSGIAADFIGLSCCAVMTALFYFLFKPVNRSVSLLAVFFSVVGCAVQAFACLFRFVPMLVLGRAQYLTLFTVDQLQPIALMLLKWHAQAFNISLAFFGFYCVLIGYLIFSSTFLPRTASVLMALGGLSYLMFLSPALAQVLFPYILVAGAIGEGSLMLWLLLHGVNVQRWNEQAGQTRPY
jgi:hypothetical protein